MSHRSRRTLSGLFVLAALAVPSAASAVNTVTVDASDQFGQVVAPTAVAIPGPTVNKDGTNTCSSTTGASALESATSGDWAGTFYSGLGYSVDRIKASALSYAENSLYWQVLTGSSSATLTSSNYGVCGIDATDPSNAYIRFVATCGDAACLSLRVPRPYVAPDSPFSVTVRRTTGSTSANATDGTTVSGGGSTATTTGGQATLTLTQRGPVTLTASRSGDTSDAQTVCVSSGSDGFCGTSAGGGGGGGSSSTPTAPGSTTSTPVTSGPAGPTPGPTSTPTPDRTAPRARISSVTARTYAHGHGPKTLSGTVAEAMAGGARRPDQSGLKSVSLRLTRKVGKRCTTFSFTRERFVKARCGADNGKFYVVGKEAKLSYLLPSRLGPGRYVLDALAEDNAGNKDTKRVSGANRVVFRVR